MKKYLTIKNIIVTFGIVVVLSISFVLNKTPRGKEITDEIITKANIVLNNEIKEDVKSSFYVDIKGAVKKPGVYIFNEENIVADVLTAAGGLIKNATTSNINLSKKLKPEMVIYIFTKNELKTKVVEKVIVNNIPECKCEIIEVNNCIEKPVEILKDQPIILSENTLTEDKQSTTVTEEISNIININTATLTQLQELPGIGESKAKAIIQYRETKGLFITIEDIKNVSGIGDLTYNNLKDKIKV